MPEPEHARRLALCVCTAGRPAMLTRLLTALERTETPAGDVAVSLIVVDNRPGGEAPAVLARAAPRLPFEATLVTEPTPGISAARNRAVAAALERDADLVAFVDDDDLPRSDWLVHLLATYGQTGADIVFGSHRQSPETAVPYWLQRSSLFERKPLPGLSIFGIPAGASTCNVLLSRGLLLDLRREGGPFRPQFAGTGGGDTDLFIRAVRHGYAYAVSQESEVWRSWGPERLTWAGMTRRSFRYGVTRRRLLDVHGESVTRGESLRGAFVLLLRKGVRILIALHRRRRLARCYFSFVDQLGEIYALLGGRYDYYPSGLSPTIRRE